MAPMRKSPEKGEPKVYGTVYDVPNETKTEAKSETVNESNEMKQGGSIDIEKKIEEVATRVVQKASEIGDWISFTVKQVDGATTSLMLQITVNAREKAVMFTLRTPQVKNKPNMLKLPSIEHLQLLRDIAKYIVENYDKIEKLFVAICNKLGTEPVRRRTRRSMGETLEL